MPVTLKELLDLADEWLQPQAINDYCPNGLQVEGRTHVKKLVTGVTASQALLDAAVAAGADAILVHHGYFWRGEDPCIRGMKGRRIRTLLSNEISLLAYHLPLDMHPVLGNNVQLANRLGIEVTGGLEPGGKQSVGLYGYLIKPVTAAQFREQLHSLLGRVPLHIGNDNRLIKSIGWCTGAAQGYIEQAVALGLDAYLTGEVSESTVHCARETGVEFFSAGHHATERYGVQALGERLAATLGIEHQYIEVNNPV